MKDQSFGRYELACKILRNHKITCNNSKEKSPIEFLFVHVLFFTGDDCRLSPTTENQRALEIELEMIRQALDGKIGEEKKEKDRFLQEFCKLRAKHQELLNRNIQARRNLKQVCLIVENNFR